MWTRIRRGGIGMERVMSLVQSCIEKSQEGWSEEEFREWFEDELNELTTDELIVFGMMIKETIRKRGK